VAKSNKKTSSRQDDHVESASVVGDSTTPVAKEGSEEHASENGGDDAVSETASGEVESVVLTPPVAEEESKKQASAIDRDDASATDEIPTVPANGGDDASAKAVRWSEPVVIAEEVSGSGRGEVGTLLGQGRNGDDASESVVTTAPVVPFNASQEQEPEGTQVVEVVPVVQPETSLGQGDNGGGLNAEGAQQPESEITANCGAVASAAVNAIWDFFATMPSLFPSCYGQATNINKGEFNVESEQPSSQVEFAGAENALGASKTCRYVCC